MPDSPLYSFETVIARQKLLRRGRMTWFHWLVVILLLILTVGAWRASSHQVDIQNQQKFEQIAAQVVELVKERMQLYENVLWGAAAHLDVHASHISYAQWLTYTNSLKIDQAYPGINGIGVIYNIMPSEVEGFLAEQRRDRPDFAIHPPHDQSEYWPITFIEPARPNAKAVGLDIAFETNRHVAAMKARDTGTAQVTGPIILVQDAKKTPGFLFYVPFYKNGDRPQTVEARQEQIIGVTYAPFIMNKLMQGTLESKNRHVRIKISDGDAVLFNDDEMIQASENTRDKKPLYKTTATLEMYGRTWNFDIETSQAFRDISGSQQPLFILMGGLVIDTMLFGLFILLSRANRAALIYADQMNERMVEKSMWLERLNKELEQFAYIASHDLKAPINSIKQVVGWIEEDCRDVLSEESKEHIALVKSRCKRMMRLLQDLLEYSQVGRSTYPCETVALKTVCEDVLFLTGASEKFHVEVPDQHIVIQKTPLEIVLRNLISNAIKHHDQAEGEITITYEEKDDGHLMTVTDDGPGIPDAFHEKVLQMFQTLKPRDEVEGSGMGLALVKKIVEHHGGYLEIEQGRVKGACFIIFWPFGDQNKDIVTI